MLLSRAMGLDATTDEQSHEASLIYAIGRVSQGIRRELRTRLAPWQVSVQEYTTLSVLDARPGLSNAQLARRAMITPPSMIEMLAKLERRGLVQRDVDPANARILRTALTPQGRELLLAASPAVQDVEDQLLEGVSARDSDVARAVMLEAMRRLSQRDRGRSGAD
jgi:DNA-binding MarR family transcriptional regulator